MEKVKQTVPIVFELSEDRKQLTISVDTPTDSDDEAKFMDAFSLLVDTVLKEGVQIGVGARLSGATLYSDNIVFTSPVPLRRDFLKENAHIHK